MKLSIQQSDLNKALGIIQGVVPGKTTMPILTCIKLEAAGDVLTMSATNLDMSIVTKVSDVKIDKDGVIAVPASKFVSFVRSLAPGEVTLSAKGGHVSVQSGKASLSESTLGVDDFPKLPDFDDEKGHEVDAGALISMIRSTSYAVSKDETRPALMGILWEIQPTSLAMVATDAHRLARTVRGMDWGMTETENVIADTQGLLQFVRLADGQEKARLQFGNKQLSFRIGDTDLHTRIMEGPFPDYTAVIPQTNNLELTVDREALAATVRRVSITADRITNQIRLGIESGRIELTAKGTDGSQAEDEVPAGYDGEALEIGFNYNYLLDILKNIGTDSVKLSVKDSNSAALISPIDADPELGDLLCLLMPLRLAGD